MAIQEEVREREREREGERERERGREIGMEGRREREREGEKERGESRRRLIHITPGQGRIFLSKRHVCYYAPPGQFTSEVKLHLPMGSISNVRKEAGWGGVDEQMSVTVGLPSLFLSHSLSLSLSDVPIQARKRTSFAVS